MDEEHTPPPEPVSTALEALRSTPIADLAGLSPALDGALRQLRVDIERFDLEYRSALLLVETRLEVLRGQLGGLAGIEEAGEHDDQGELGGTAVVVVEQITGVVDDVHQAGGF